MMWDMKALKGEEPTGTDAEACAYLYTAGLTAVGYQVYFHEARLVLLPVDEGPDGYRPLEQTPWLGGGKSPPTSQLTAGPYQSVYGGWTDAAEMCFRRNINPLLAVIPDHPYHLR